jgi:MoaE-MoaD fusion protein
MPRGPRGPRRTGCAAWVLSGPARWLDLALLTPAFAAFDAACPTEVEPSSATTSAANASEIAVRCFMLTPSPEIELCSEGGYCPKRHIAESRSGVYATPVRVMVRLFAGLRERAGTSRSELELQDGATVADVWPALELGDEPSGLLYAVNRAYAEPDRPLTDGDEVALIPPVSGGAFRLTEGPVNLTAVVVEVVDEQAGAIATFLGTVRAQSRGREVIALEYEAYEDMAEQVMAEIAGEVKERYELCKVAVMHRTGRVEVGETSVAIAVSAPHRQDALAACADVIEALKARVPLWKKELYEGGEEWIGRGS